MHRDSFSAKTVVITGASSGIGEALALLLADEGASLTLAARDAQRLMAVAAACRQRGGQAITIPTDVAVEAQCRMLIEQTHAAYGRIDMLVNNAGMAVVGRLEELPDLQLFRRVLDVNFLGMVTCTYYALPALKEVRGRIVNIASLGGLLAIPYNSSYVASKAAMIGFSDSIRMELAQSGVSVSVVCPSWVASGFHERYLDIQGRPRGPGGRAIYTRRTMTAERCAEIVLRAARLRRRQMVMQPGPLGLWLKLLAPGLADQIVLANFRRVVTRGR